MTNPTVTLAEELINAIPVTLVPEPGSVLLAACGVLVAGGRVVRRLTGSKR